MESSQAKVTLITVYDNYEHDPELKTGRTKRQLTVVLTESERKTANFLVFYIHGYSTFFVVPQDAFPPSGSVTVYIGKDGELTTGSAFEEYRNKWDLLR